MFSRFLKRALSTINNANVLQETEIMYQVHDSNYEEAINVLNKLQSNRNVLKNINDPNSLISPTAAEKLELMKKYMFRSGISPDDLHNLPVLHVSGTKGKGSTCSFCESILRHHGYKTGFFSSPHLVEVRERIRINGVPIPKDIFSHHFWKIYKYLDEQKERPGDMPFYFQFLFIMAIHIFLKQEVDVAIIEVGIGGEYDPTNIVTNVPVAGITALGYDHTSVLGNTIESIAWNKGGIMKKGTKVFTVSQPQNAMNVLNERSIEKKCTLNVVEDDFHFPVIQKYPMSIRTNINLAIKLAEAWMLSTPTHNTRNSLIDLDILKSSIENCVWPCRYEIRQEKNIRFYIDGAHTIESMDLCLNWYLNDIKNRQGKRALMFNLTGGRSSEEFFKLLVKCQFGTVMFVPNVAKTSNESADSINLTLPLGEQLSNCNEYKAKWMSMVPDNEDVQVFPSVQEAMDYLNCNERYNLLVTGSLHLVGALSSLLNPSLNGTLQN